MTLALSFPAQNSCNTTKLFATGDGDAPLFCAARAPILSFFWGSAAKDSCSDADERCAFFDSGLKIVGHSHR